MENCAAVSLSIGALFDVLNNNDDIVIMIGMIVDNRIRINPPDYSSV